MIPSWIKWGAAALSVVALLFCFEVVSRWRLRAQAAEVAEAEVERVMRIAKDQAERARKAEQAQAIAEAKLLDAQEEALRRYDEITKRIKGVKVAVDCSVGPDAVRLLNDAAGYTSDAVPATSHAGNARGVAAR